MNIKKYISIFFIIFFSGIMILSFQNCKREESNNDKKSLVESGTGNGSGYGGKLMPGDYLAQVEGTLCTPSGSLTPTNIAGILEVNQDGSKKYYEGCDKVTSQALSVSDEDLKFFQAFPSIISYANVNLNFEFEEDIADYTAPGIEAVCWYEMPAEEVTSGLGDLLDFNIVLKNTEVDDQFETSINYSIFEDIYLNEKSIGPFDSILYSELEEGRDIYKNNDLEFELNVEKYTEENILPRGEMKLRVGQNRETFGIDMCVYNKLPEFSIELENNPLGNN